MIGPLEERDCPSADALAAWIEGRGDADARTAVEEHVAACDTCSDVVAAALPADADSTEASASPRTPFPAGRRWPGRWAIAATLAVTTAALGYGAVSAVVDRARVELARRATEALGQPVAIGRLRVTLTRGLDALEIRLGDVRIGDAAATTAEDIVARVPLASLAAGAPVVSALRLVGPVMHFGAASPVTRPGHAGGRHNAVAAAIGTAPLEIVEGTLLIDAPGAPPLAIEHLSGTTTPSDGVLQIDLRASSAGAPMRAEGTLSLADDGPLSITIVAQRLPVSALPYADGHLSGSGEFSVRVSGTVHDPVFAGRALVRDGRAVGWNPLPGALAGIAPEGAAVAPPSGGGDLVFDELRVIVEPSPGGWRVPRLYGTGAGLVVGASFEIGAEHTVHGEGSVRIPAAAVNALVAAHPSLASLRDADGALTLPIVIAGSLDAPRLTLAGEDTAPPPAP